MQKYILVQFQVLRSDIMLRFLFCYSYLLNNHNRSRSVNDVMPMIGARFYTQLDAAQLRNDVLEHELSRELECGRLFRLLCKLNIINDRPE